MSSEAQSEAQKAVHHAKRAAAEGENADYC